MGIGPESEESGLQAGGLGWRRDRVCPGSFRTSGRFIRCPGSLPCFGPRLRRSWLSRHPAGPGRRSSTRFLHRGGLGPGCLLQSFGQSFPGLLQDAALFSGIFVGGSGHLLRQLGGFAGGFISHPNLIRFPSGDLSLLSELGGFALSGCEGRPRPRGSLAESFQFHISFRHASCQKRQVRSS